MKNFTKNNKGFTLIELVIVVAIIGILATAIISGTNFIDQRAQSVDVANYNVARNLQAAFEQYAVTTGLSDLESSTSTAIKGDSANITKLVNAGILKSNFQIPEGIFFLDTSNGIVVQYNLTSARYIKSMCNDTKPCVFKVPSSGALK
jgi:type IV pilus assembly protein PilA